MNRALFILSFSPWFLSIKAQDLNYYWAQQFGHSEYANDIQAVTSDNQDRIIGFTHFNAHFMLDGQDFIAEDGDDLLVFALNEEGEKQWAFSDGGMGNQVAQQIACDADGNIFLMGKFAGEMSIAGESFESNGSFDMYLIKLDQNGNVIWTKTFGGPKSESFEAMNIRGDKINIVGRFYDYTILNNDTIWGLDGTDFYAAQFDLDANLLDYVVFGGEGVDYVSDVTSDLAGNIYITGDFYQNLQIGEETLEAGDMLGIYLIKLNSNLEIQWFFQPEGSDLKPGVLIDCDSDGNLVMSGNFSGEVSFGNIQLQTADFDEDIYMTRFSSDGDVEWAKRFYSTSMENVTGLNMDRTGQIYISGHYLNHIHFNELVIQYNLCCGDPEIFFVKFDEEGDVLEYSQLTGERSNLKDMFVPELNQVIFAGQFSEHFQIGDIEMNSPTSYNVFVSYLKDDTWLKIPEENQMKARYLINNISKQSFELQDLPRSSQIFIFNDRGQQIEQLRTTETSISIGENWPMGFYFIKIIGADSEETALKVLKL